MSNGTKTKRAVIVTDLDAMELRFHEPEAAPPGSKSKWIPGALIRAIRVADYPQDIRNIAMLTVGFRNTFMDQYADPSVDIAQALEDRHNTLLAGNWSAKGESSERAGLFVQAYAAIKGLSVEEVRNKVNAIESGDDDSKKAALAAWRKSPDIAAKMAEIQIENARKRMAAAHDAAKEAEAMADL